MYYGGGLQKCLGLLITCLVAWEIGISAIQSKLSHIDVVPHILPVFLLHLKRYHNGMCVYIIEKFTKKRQKQVTSFSKVYLKRATTLSSPISDGTLQLISPCSDFSRMPLLVVRSTPVTWAAISTPRGCGRPESTSSSTPATPVPPLRWRFRYNT